MENQKERYVFSQYVVAWLNANGVMEIRQDKTEDNKTRFWFDNTDQFNNLITQFKKDIMLQKFVLAIKEVKIKIHK